ncbi:MAG: hypothetical protein EOP83_23545 [Verrucomicrobiaceae bacterium]|nr:MAG: hypothetical protein EOP83_23545 [Verrucomicrobiaceae bacterium]
MQENYQHLEGDRLLTATVEENVLVQLENLRTLPAVASKLRNRDLNLHGWVYGLKDGRIKPLFEMKANTPIDPIYQCEASCSFQFLFTPLLSNASSNSGSGASSLIFFPALLPWLLLCRDHTNVSRAWHDSLSGTAMGDNR